jgi:hypothetical protein
MSDTFFEDFRRQYGDEAVQQVLREISSNRQWRIEPGDPDLESVTHISETESESRRAIDNKGPLIISSDQGSNDEDNDEDDSYGDGSGTDDGDLVGDDDENEHPHRGANTVITFLYRLTAGVPEYSRRLA